MVPDQHVEGVADRARREDELGYTEDEQRRLQRLRQRDQEVRAHEQAHVAAAGGLVRGPPRYTLVKGPDGQMYAIGGHVQIDTSPEPTPEKTIEKARKIKAAALAPGDPSPQDLQVAARASMMELRARGELREAEAAEKSGSAKAGQPSAGGHAGATPEDPATPHAGRYPFDRPGHLEHCPHCQHRAFFGRFKPGPVQVFGVA
jgi:hypothetical protein